MFPSNGSTRRRPLPSTGPSRVECPGFRGTMERSDSLSPSRRAWLCFAWRYHEGRRWFAPVGSDAWPTGRGLVIRGPLAGSNIVGSTGRSKFLGNPGVPVPSSSTPAGANTPGLRGVPARPPWRQRRGLPAGIALGAQWPGLGAGCLRFVIRVARGRRRTRFRLLARLCRLGLGTHRVPARGFQEVVVTSSPPLPGFAWRNVTSNMRLKPHQAFLMTCLIAEPQPRLLTSRPLGEQVAAIKAFGSAAPQPLVRFNTPRAVRPGAGSRRRRR